MTDLRPSPADAMTDMARNGCDDCDDGESSERKMADLPESCKTLLGFTEWVLSRVRPNLLAKHGNAPIQIGSFCSGLCTEKLCADALSKIVEAAGGNLSFSHPFAAEVDERKRLFTQQNHKDIAHAGSPDTPLDVP